MPPKKHKCVDCKKVKSIYEGMFGDVVVYYCTEDKKWKLLNPRDEKFLGGKGVEQ